MEGESGLAILAESASEEHRDPLPAGISILSRDRVVLRLKSPQWRGSKYIGVFQSVAKANEAIEAILASPNHAAEIPKYRSQKPGRKRKAPTEAPAPEVAALEIPEAAAPVTAVPAAVVPASKASLERRRLEMRLKMLQTEIDIIDFDLMH